MALFRITVKAPRRTAGAWVEKGMTVDIVSKSLSNPILIDGGQEVINAFQRVYGVNIKQAGALNTTYLDVQRIG
jgi:hypothetical protein